MPDPFPALTLCGVRTATARPGELQAATGPAARRGESLVHSPPALAGRAPAAVLCLPLGEGLASAGDEDLAAVVVYLRTLPPVRNALPATSLPDAERARIATGPQPITEPVPGPAPGDSTALGRYLVGVADCAGLPERGLHLRDALGQGRVAASDHAVDRVPRPVRYGPRRDAPIEFRLPAAGAATSLVSLEIEPVALDRSR